MGRARVRPTPWRVAVVDERGEVVRHVRQIERRVKVRAGELGLRLQDVAARMGYTTQHEFSEALARRRWTLARFRDLERALEGPDWSRRLEPPDKRARRVILGLFRNATGKSMAPRKTGGDQSSDE